MAANGSAAPADVMSPGASPGGLQRPGAGVRRVNNMPLWIGLGVLGGFLLVMFLVASERASNQHQPPTPATGKGGSSAIVAKQIAGIDDAGAFVPAEEPAPVAPVEPAPLRQRAPAAAGGVPAVTPEDRREIRPAPPAAPRAPGDTEADRIRQARIQQLISGAHARTSVQLPAERMTVGGTAGGAGFGGPGGASTDPRAAYAARMAQLQGGGLGGAAGMGVPGGLGGGAAGGTGGGGKSIAQFGTQGPGDRWALYSRPEAPRSRYEIRAGFVIPAILMSGINSDLPGQIMAQVSENVYDTPTGKYVLIPQGSRLVGAYSSDVAFGQARVLVAWQRIDFPDGKAMDIGAMPGADSAGYAGFADKVNNHYVRLFGSAILLSAVTAGVAYSQDRNQGGGGGGYYNSQPDFSSSMSEALGQQLGQVTGQLLSKNMNVSPTLEIRPGYRFNVLVTKDLDFDSPYRAFDYYTRSK